MAELPDRARIVIVGGGVGGASVAYHLARRGETDVLLVERAELTSGSTFHSAGLVGQLRSDPALTRMNVHSVALYRELAAGEHDPGWTESGSLRLASSPERLVEIRRQHGWAQRAGLPLELVSAAEARELFPLMGDGRGAGRGVHADRRPDRPRPAVHRAGRRCARRRGADRPADPGGGIRHRHRAARAAGRRGAHRPGRRRVRGRRRSAAACTPPRSRRWWTCGSRWCRCRTSTSSRRRCPRERCPGGRCRRCAIPTCSSTTGRRSTAS